MQAKLSEPNLINGQSSSQSILNPTCECKPAKLVFQSLQNWLCWCWHLTLFVPSDFWAVSTEPCCCTAQLIHLRFKFAILPSQHVQCGRTACRVEKALPTCLTLRSFMQYYSQDQRCSWTVYLIICLDKVNTQSSNFMPWSNMWQLAHINTRASSPVEISHWDRRPFLRREWEDRLLHIVYGRIGR